jgi:hypothetical protein
MSWLRSNGAQRAVSTAFRDFSIACWAREARDMIGDVIAVSERAQSRFVASSLGEQRVSYIACVTLRQAPDPR